MSAEVGKWAQELQDKPELVQRILWELPPVPQERQFIVRCSLETVEQACARAWALAQALGELWRVEIVR